MDEIDAGLEFPKSLEGAAENHVGNAESMVSNLQQDLDDDDDFLPPEPQKKNTLECDICGKILGSRQALKAHAITHVDPANRQTFRCEICESTFKSQRGLSYHLDTKHISGSKRKKLPCPTCDRVFKSVEGRKIHMTIQHGADGPIFKCQECPMVFARKPHLELHMATHGSGLHVCTICGKSYARLKDLSKHEATCGVQELCCSECGKQFRKEQALENHEKKCRPTTSRNVRCLTCGQGFASEQTLKTHQAVHRRTFRCGECTRTFDTVLALRNHEQTKHSKTVGCEGVETETEKRGRRKKNGGAEKETKVRMRRSKYDLFIGLEHLADPSTLIEEVKPVEKEIKPADPSPRRFACELCPANFASKRSLMNHRQRQHWEVLGLQEPITRPRKVVSYVDPDELPQEANIDAGIEVNVLKLEDTTSEQTASNVVMIANYTDPERLLEEISDARSSDNPTNGSVDNAVFCRTFYVEENPEPNVEIIKEEIIEFEDYSYDQFENDSACNDEQVDGVPFESVVADSEIPEEQTTEEVDTLAVEPALETNVPNEPLYSKELVIMLEKLDYSSLAKPPLTKNTLPRVACTHCGKTFAHRYRLVMHRIKEHGSTETAVLNNRKPKTTLPPNFHCDQCDKSYHTETKLALHKEKVHGIGKAPIRRRKNIRKRTCPLCRKQFYNSNVLVYHLQFIHGKTADETKFVRCSKCRKHLVTAEEIAEHVCLREIAVEKERPFKCNLCDKTYSTFPHLEDHFSVHPEHQRYKCDQCLKGFFKERQLTRHMKNIHKSLETYIACETCCQLFKTHNSWKRHQETHNDLKLYCCEHCGKKFKSRVNLNSHKRNSHPEHVSKTALANQSIPCKICGQTLRGRPRFNSHMLRHNSKPTLKCFFPSCGKMFYENAYRRIHEQSHTKDYQFKCNFCEYGTVARKRIVLHEQRKHNYDRFAGEN